MGSQPFSAFEQVAAAMPSGVIIYGLEATTPRESTAIVYTNQASSDILGCETPCGLLKDIFPAVLESDFPERLAMALVGDAQDWDYIAGENDVRAGVYHCRAFGIGDGKHVAVVYDDVTDTRRTEQRVQDHRSDLEEYAYITSHDLRSPLRAITELASMLVEDLGDRLEGEPAEQLALIADRARRLDQLIVGLAAYFRATVGEKRQNEVVTVAQVADDVWALYGTPQFEFVVDAAVEIEVDRTIFERVLSNVIDNAIKHHPTGTGVISVHAEPRGRYVVVRVDDDGEGIAEEHRARALRLFQRLRKAPPGGAPSTGLGLALVRQHVRRLNGRVRLLDSDMGGLRVELTLPRVYREGMRELVSDEGAAV